MRRHGYAVAAVGTAAVLFWSSRAWLADLGCAIPDAARQQFVIWGADARLIVYVLTWIADTLPSAPGRLFDPPVGYPAPGALTGSEHFLSTQLVFAPVYAASGNPVLAASVATLASYLAGGLLMLGLLRAWGLAPLAAFAGALANMFGPMQTPSDLHVVEFPSWCLPLAAWGAERVIEAPAARRTAALAVFLILGFLASYHIGANVGLLLVLLILGEAMRGRAPGALVLALGVALIVLVVISLPYLARLGEPAPHLGVARAGWDFASSFWRQIALGEMRWSVLVAAALGLVLRRRLSLASRRAHTVGTLAALVGCTLLAGWSLRLGGISIPLPYALFSFTPFASMLGPTWFISLAGFGLAILAACAVEAARAAEGRIALATATCLVAAIGIESARAYGPRPLTCLPVGTDVPPVYRWLRDQTGALLEVPRAPFSAPTGEHPLSNAEAMYASLLHGLPVLNLHTNRMPPATRLALDLVDRLPDEDVLQALVDMTHLRWIVVHRDRLAPALVARWQEFALDGLTRVGDFDEALLYRVEREPRAAGWFAAASRPPRPDTTLLGTPLRPLAAPVAALEVRALAAPLRPGERLEVPLRLANRGTEAWPVAVPRGAPETFVVRLEVRWSGAAEHVNVVPLPFDLEPGRDVRLRAALSAPREEGTYEVRWGLAQGDGSRFVELAKSAGRVVAPRPQEGT